MAPRVALNRLAVKHDLLPEAAYMIGVIPQPDHRPGKVVFITQSAQTGRAQHEGCGMDCRFGAYPARSQNPNEMSTRKQHYVARDGTYPRYDAVGSSGYLLRRFTSRAPIPKKLPAGPLQPDLCRAETLVFAVIPLDQVRIDLSYRTEPCELAGSERPLQRARKHLVGIQPLQPVPETQGDMLTGFRQWQVREPRMLSGEAPRGFTMPGEIDNLKVLAQTLLSLVVVLSLVSPT